MFVLLFGLLFVVWWVVVLIGLIIFLLLVFYYEVVILCGFDGWFSWLWLCWLFGLYWWLSVICLFLILRDVVGLLVCWLFVGVGCLCMCLLGWVVDCGCLLFSCLVYFVLCITVGLVWLLICFGLVVICGV